MSRSPIRLHPSRPLTVGSFGDDDAFAGADPGSLPASCDLAEVRLDLLDRPGERPWAPFLSTPLLFTARRGDEGGRGDLPPSRRLELLLAALPDAGLVDLELASAGEMQEIFPELSRLGLPWIASFHDFEGRPETFDRIPALAGQAAALGAACFKAAVRLHQPADLARLVAPLTRPSPLPLSLMGMGPLAPVSRLLAAQYGSVLNYGYLGSQPTAPGQWSAARLHQAIASLSPCLPPA